MSTRSSALAACFRARPKEPQHQDRANSSLLFDLLRIVALTQAIEKGKKKPLKRNAALPHELGKFTRYTR